MFENIGSFFKKIMKPEQKELLVEATSKDAAKERLHIVLMQDRANVSADFLELMKQEIIDVIKKYIVIDEEQIDVRLTNQENDDGTTGAPALYANIPIINIRNDIKGEYLNQDNSKEKVVENNISSSASDDIASGTAVNEIDTKSEIDIVSNLGTDIENEIVTRDFEITEEDRKERQELNNNLDSTLNSTSETNDIEKFDNSEEKQIDHNDKEVDAEEYDNDDDDITFDDLLKAAEEEEKKLSQIEEVNEDTKIETNDEVKESDENNEAKEETKTNSVKQNTKTTKKHTNKKKNKKSSKR